MESNFFLPYSCRTRPKEVSISKEKSFAAMTGKVVESMGVFVTSVRPEDRVFIKIFIQEKLMESTSIAI